jgi:hypothetical protein
MEECIDITLNVETIKALCSKQYVLLSLILGRPPEALRYLKLLGYHGEDGTGAGGDGLGHPLV